MFSPFHVMLFERGPTPLLSIGVSVLAIVLIVRLKPESNSQFCSALLLSVLPVLLGIAGFYYGMATAYIGWCEFVSTNPSQQLLEEGRRNLMIGYAVAGEPVHIGLLSCLPPLLVVFWYWLVSKTRRRGEHS